MIDIDPADLLDLIYSKLIDISGPTKDSELSMLAAPVGSNFKSGKSEPYTLRMFSSELRVLKQKAKSGNPLDAQLMSLLYKTGLCFNRDEILSALWAQMPPHGAVKLPNEQVIYHSDITKIAVRHLKTLFKRSLIFAYPPDVIDFYSNVMAEFAASGNKSTFAVMYKTVSSTKAVLSQAVYCDENVFVDCTVQARLFNLVPAEIEDDFFESFLNTRFVVVGNLTFKGKDFSEKALKDFLCIEDNAEVPTVVDIVAQDFVSKYKETYRKAQSYLLQKRRKPDVQAKAEKLIAAYVEAESKARRSVSDSRSAYKKSVKFIAHGLCKTVSRVGRTLKNDKVLSIPKTKAEAVQRKLTEMGFTCDSQTTLSGSRKSRA